MTDLVEVGRSRTLADAKQQALVLAAVGIGLWPTVDAACDALVRRATVTEPRPAHSAAMNHQYAAYTRLYPALGSIHG